MLFQHTLDLVLSGQKTKTSRVIAHNDAAEYGRDGRIEAVKTNGRDKYRVGKSYAVQPARGKPAVARIRLLSIDRQRVRDTTTEQAQGEGAADREAFFEMWHTVHGTDKLDADVWVLTFELITKDG